MGIIGIPGLYNFLSSCLLIKGLLITVFIYSAERNSSLFGAKLLSNFLLLDRFLYDPLLNTYYKFLLMLTFIILFLLLHI